MSKKGGKRIGAGRPKGSTRRPRITDHFSQKEIDALVRQAKREAKKDLGMLRFLLEQVFGKARQTVIGGGDGEDPIRLDITMRKEINSKINDLL